MSSRNQFLSLILSAACLLLTSCARPLLVVQASTTDLVLDFDAYVDKTNDLEIAYDFWSPDGVPFISFLNLTADTILLDLDRSQLRQARENRRVSLDDAILLQTDYGSYQQAYPDLEFKRIDRKTYLILAPQKWASIYGPSCHTMRTIRRGDGVIYTYVYEIDGLPHEVSHGFNLIGLTRLSRKEIDTYQRTDAGPDQYFIDQSGGSEINATNVLIQILLAVLFAV